MRKRERDGKTNKKNLKIYLGSLLKHMNANGKADSTDFSRLYHQLLNNKSSF